MFNSCPNHIQVAFFAAGEHDDGKPYEKEHGNLRQHAHAVKTFTTNFSTGALSGLVICRISMDFTRS